jgi:ABC-type microcin C transport system permease subunit YejE
VLLVTHIVESGKTRCPLCYLLLILSSPVTPGARCVIVLRILSSPVKVLAVIKENIHCHLRYGYLITCQQDRDVDHKIF